jgi:hypothetical protein
MCVLLCRRCRFDADLRPVHIELFSDQHRQPGVNALPHLRLVDDDRDDVIRRNADPLVRRKGLPFGGQCLGRRQRAADRKSSAGKRGNLDEFSSIHSHVFISLH